MARISPVGTGKGETRRVLDKVGRKRLLTVRIAPKADIREGIEQLCFVPIADIAPDDILHLDSA